MAKAHVLVLPLPAQGHITPLMELSHRLVDHGFEVTFITTEVHHALVVGALRASGGEVALGGGIHLASIPDGLANDDDRKDLIKLFDAIPRHMPGHLEQLIAGLEAAGRPAAKWLVSDVSMGWSFEVARKFGIRAVSLIEDGLIDDKGSLRRHEMFELAKGMPQLHTSQLPWINDSLNALAEMTVANSFHEAEPSACGLFPNILPIGPLSADKKPVGNFLQEDGRCIKWLDAQPDRSVVYVAFGSIAILDGRQFEELAEGLELAGRPFLLVVRPDFSPGGLSKAWLDEFRQHLYGRRGMVVSWCSQQQVLAHRAVACFVSHCGWNSTMEGVSYGVPFLCWPYFCDQHLNRNYITNLWRTGRAVSPDVDGIVTKEELRSKVEQVIGDAGIKERARLFADVARQSISEGGSSYENFKRFVNLLSG
ncbi:hypothetical protein PVAP13_8NG163000 [Panicum virgatum]|uniref:Glycosyltransferase n=1 Tax=Panicum virgatum TaxID=38727 RepID=A0A8T0P546_PANVG|nr:hypothetical protein PVAP13_8NG163000 [Panicum virgatum]